jgi:hypothetical protein
MSLHRRHALFLGLLLALAVPTARAAECPAWLPHYDLDIRFDLEHHQALVRERVSWTNRGPCAVKEMVFNVHSYYKIPAKDVGFLAKMLEILRLAPSEGLDFEGHACQIQKVSLVSVAGPGAPTGQAPPPQAAAVSLPFKYQEENLTALEAALPRPLAPGETVTLDLEFTMRLPPKQGRWGQWCGVTFLAQWLPVVAVHGPHGWEPAPFIPWHQPFYNEAGVYTGRVTLPADQKLACTCSVAAETDLGDGIRQVELAPRPARDFAIFCSARFHEYTGQAGPVRVRVLAFPEHEFYAQAMVRIACEAIPTYSKWFGPYPYSEFTIVESYFGWNGNECGALVMIDERIFDMPHLAMGFVDYLVSHEICHQWWYNVVGTNGFCETWMDEGLATFFGHKLMTVKHGKNSEMLNYPKCLSWLPNIHRDDYRHYSFYGTLARGECTATVQPIEGFGHLVNLNSMTYDKGAKIVGMIEARLGECAFLDFMRHIYAKYHFGILRVADYQHELEAYTGTSWDEFFKNWLYGKGMTDWCLEHVDVWPAPCAPADAAGGCPGPAYQATIFLKQKAEVNEQTVLGICLDATDNCQVRLPIVPGAPPIRVEDPPATIQCLADNVVRVDVTLPSKPTQIMVDPDQILVDKNPDNNRWKRRVRCRVTPLYTLLDDTDLTNSYDRWNFTLGPWLFGGTNVDPWFTRSEMVGLRAGAYRLQEFAGGAYLAYRTDERDVVAGVDGLWDHWPWCHTQVGFVAERGLTEVSDGRSFNRGVLFGRYVIAYGDSLYLPPMHYVELFGSIQDNALPFTHEPEPGAERFDHQTTAGVHYHLDYLTPYWDPEGGFRIDATYQTGVAIFGEEEAFNEVMAQVSYVKCMPDLHGPDWLEPFFCWFGQTRLALRAFGGLALPNKGEFFALGGGERFRGFDLAQRQGSLVWVGSVEWRVPLAKGLQWDCLDHVAGLRNIYAAAFYDAGNAYVRGHEVGDTAHALGVGLRLDVAWFGLIERTMLRFDVAKTVNENSPAQFWFGIQHPF